MRSFTGMHVAYTSAMHLETNIDPSVLLAAAGDELDIALELLKMFFDLTKPEMDRLIEAAASGDANSVSEAAHKIVGSAVTLGLEGLAADLRDLEQRSKHALPADIDERIQRMQAHLEQARSFFQTHFAEQLP